MDYFKEETIGQPIDEFTSEYLRIYTNTKDRKTVAPKYKISESTIRDVIYQGSRITERNRAAMNEMKRIADEQFRESQRKARQFKTTFEIVK